MMRNRKKFEDSDDESDDESEEDENLEVSVITIKDTLYYTDNTTSGVSSMYTNI